MEIKLEEAKKLIEKYGQENVPIIYLNDINLVNRSNSLRISKGLKFDQSQYDLLSDAGIMKFDVVYNENLHQKLLSTFPNCYRKPAGKGNIIELDKIVDELNKLNSLSKRKRCIISLSEIYKSSNIGNTPILFYGEKLDYARWNQVKVHINRSTLIDYTYDEGGIIIFYILNASDPLYMQKFMKFTDLVSIIVESKSSGITIAPELNLEKDIYTVNDKSKLLETYDKTKASLIIMGEDLNNEYKEALMQIKSYDRYVKMMVIKDPSPKNKTEILNKIKSVYQQIEQ